MLNNTSYIAIAGYKNAGKDTTAEMLRYCLNTPSFLHSYSLFKLFKKWKGKYKTVSFAKPLKGMLAVLLNVPVSKFENRDFKDATYVYFPTLEIRKDPPKDKTLTEASFNNKLNKMDYEFINTHYITIRQLLQCFGTEIMRKTFGDKLWILATLKEKNLIISDLRFKTELTEIQKRGGKIIYISRPGCLPGNHASEKELSSLYDNNAFDYVIDNNKSKKDLFYTVASLI